MQSLLKLYKDYLNNPVWDNNNKTLCKRVSVESLIKLQKETEKLNKLIENL